ncbi:MAG: anti-sigma regulatory factor [Phycisphaerae bacterium]
MSERVIKLNVQQDLIEARQAVRELARSMGFSLVDQTRVATAVSEIVRNVFMFAGEGTCTISSSRQSDRMTLSIVVEDRGPGIDDISAALQDGTSSIGSSGLGMPSAQRLMHTFKVESKVGWGTRVTMTLTRHVP